PLTANGKLDRKALPDHRPSGGVGRAPRDGREETLCRLFAEVLDLERTTIDDSFFESGGDSIMATRFVRLARAAGLRITVRDVFRHKTVASLAALPDLGAPSHDTKAVTARAATEYEPSADELAQARAAVPGAVDVLPLSPLQEGLYFHHRFDTDSVDHYNAQLVLTFEGDLDAAALHIAADLLLARHASLRCCFPEIGTGRVLAVTTDVTAAPWYQTDLTHLAPAEREAAWDGLLNTERQTRFDLSAAPLIRFTVATTGPRQWRLALTNHHIVLDGWSLPLLVRDLLALYAGQTAPQTPAPTTSVEAPSYRDYLGWLGGRDHDAAREAWIAALAGVDEPTRLGAVRPAGGSAAQCRIQFALPDRAARALTDVSRAQGITLSTLVQAAWALLIGRMTGRDDVLFGVASAGRPAEVDGVDTVVGLFVNTLPLRATLRPAETVARFLQRLQDEQAELIDHQHIGLAELQRRVGIGELFDTLVVFENFPLGQEPVLAEAARAGLSFSGYEVRGGTHYALSLAAIPGGDGDRMDFRLDYRPDLVDAEYAERLADRLLRVVDTLVTDPETRVGDVGVLTGDERHTVVEEWNATDTAAPAGDAVELFRARAARTPQAVALVYGDVTLTYAELDARSERLAGLLAAQGVRPERYVAVSLPRSP
ncbi:condensation domain-containing protein, partial [Streptomyces sp. NPDC058171]